MAVAKQEELYNKGIQHLLTPIVLECDTRVAAVMKSQSELSEQIRILTETLQKINDQKRVPVAVTYVAKLSDVNLRLHKLQAAVLLIQQRLAKMQYVHSNPQDTSGLSTSFSALIWNTSTTAAPAASTAATTAAASSASTGPVATTSTPTSAAPLQTSADTSYQL